MFFNPREEKPVGEKDEFTLSLPNDDKSKHKVEKLKGEIKGMSLIDATVHLASRFIKKLQEKDFEDDQLFEKIATELRMNAEQIDNRANDKTNRENGLIRLVSAIEHARQRSENVALENHIEKSRWTKYLVALEETLKNNPDVLALNKTYIKRAKTQSEKIEYFKKTFNRFDFIKNCEDLRDIYNQCLQRHPSQELDTLFRKVYFFGLHYKDYDQETLKNKAMQLQEAAGKFIDAGINVDNEWEAEYANIIVSMILPKIEKIYEPQNLPRPNIFTENPPPYEEAPPPSYDEEEEKILRKKSG